MNLRQVDKALTAAEALLREKYTSELMDFLRYMEAGFQVEDFSTYLLAYFEDTGQDLPEGFDLEEPWEYAERMPPLQREYFKEWIANGGLDDIAPEASLPTYIYMSYPELLKRTTWLVHFSDAAYDIATAGFEYGHWDMTTLGLTTWFSETVRKEQPGYNFAFRAESKYANSAANLYRAKYGKQAVMFQSAGVECMHFGDEEKQVVFWGPAVTEFVYLAEPYAASGWAVWGLDRNEEEREYYHGSFGGCVDWVIANVNQYRRRIVHTI